MTARLTVEEFISAIRYDSRHGVAYLDIPGEEARHLPLPTAPSPDAPGQREADVGGEVEAARLAEVVITIRDDHDWPTETDDGVIMRCRCGATPPSHFSGQQVDDALWLWRHQHNETGKALASVVAAARADAEGRLGEVRALADEWDATVYKLPPGYPMTVNEFCHYWFKAPLRAVLDAAGPREGERK